MTAEKRAGRVTWEVGDWCFYEFRLAQVEKVENCRVTAVNDGVIKTGGYNLPCVPLTLRNSVISREFVALYTRLRKEGVDGLDMGNLKDWLAGKWMSACNADDDGMRSILDATEARVEQILDMCRELGEKEVDGVKVFRVRRN